ncbi:helix-turn-helix domain-containing protein [Streptomyces sp. NEAU-Y11]|uniref:helix-turn-helix domain-containing protein n=1 Tax=Streptomyces cucumeris TaxID=2962890 RepID=UPI0020C8B813|nr:helix-turn-helix transcriptional regulator [Streptomyces sp. NEAU-Y11]MCP9209938.1 helix-turn-helix domain-containing protein [Streptomyces sp. NEAU-Y11]
MTDRRSFGQRVRFYRKRRGLHQWQLGELLNRSEDWVYRVEAGLIPVNNVKMLADLADALRVHVEDLQGAPTLLEDHDDHAASVPAIRAALMRSRRLAGSLYDDREPLRLERLAVEVDTAWNLYQHAQYAQLASRLPSLVADARVATQEYSEGTDRAEALRLFALTCHVTAAFLRKLGEINLAWTAADQGDVAASASGDLAAVVALRRCVAHVQLGAGLAADAVSVTEDAAADLPDDWWKSSAVSLSLYGTLLLNGSVAAARLRDRPLAEGMIARAEKAADRLGRDANEMWTSFGPSNVEIHRLALALEFEDVQLAVDIAPRVKPAGLPLERRARARLDVARAYGEAGRTDDAIDHLKRAYKNAPEQMRAHGFARDLARRLYKRSPRRDVRELALGLGAID